MLPRESSNDPETTVNPAERIAKCTKRYIRVLAGPGTGKSYAIKMRVGRLLDEGIAPEEILTVTLTQVMADDLTKDLREIKSPGAERLRAYSLHVIAEEILNAPIGAEGSFVPKRAIHIFELTPLFHDLAHRLGEFLSGSKEARKMFGKRDAAWATDYDEIAQGTRSNEEIKFDVVVREWLEFHRCVWRGHLVSALYNYLYENPHAQARSKYKHLLVDEFQDLNPVEQQILSLLAQNAAICVFGDENQSIYSFRYANPKGILQWGQGKPAAEFVSFTLSDCYRCPKNIVEMANHLITHNTGYTNPDRNLIAQPDRCGEGRSIWGVFETTSEEIDWIAASVKRRLDEGLSGSDVLILAPNVGIANKIARVIFGSGITARCYYDESILTTNIARVAFSMLNLLVNPDDAASLRWLLGNGSRDWHADAYGAATAYAHENGGTVRDCLDRAASGQIELLGATHLVSRFKKLKVELAELQSLGIALLLDQLFPANNDAVAGLRRIAEAAAKPRGAKLSDILAAIHDSLKTPKFNAEVDAVRIMSLHKSKGLGARVVYVAGCANDYLPGHKPSGLTDAEWKIRLEERRRLFYVALTRVKGSSKEPQGEIILTHAVKNGRRSTRSPSIFIRELGGAKPIPVADPEA